MAIGEEPDPSILPVGAGIEMGHRPASSPMPGRSRPASKGVFAGGDVVSGPKTIIDAVAAGRRAAGAIHGYLGGGPNGEAEVMAAVRYRTPPGARCPLDLAPRAARNPARTRWMTSGPFGARQEGFADRGRVRGRPLLPL